VGLLSQMGKEIKRLYEDAGVNKILTIEASGIAIASITAQYFECPMLFAKKTKTINIAVEFDTLDKIQIAKAKYGDNLTKYINALIEKDLEANYEEYKSIYEMLNK
jgi:predicted DNA binding CopG/RHH family protein